MLQKSDWKNIHCLKSYESKELFFDEKTTNQENSSPNSFNLEKSTISTCNFLSYKQLNIEKDVFIREEFNHQGKRNKVLDNSQLMIKYRTLTLPNLQKSIFQKKKNNGRISSKYIDAENNDKKMRTKKL